MDNFKSFQFNHINIIYLIKRTKTLNYEKVKTKLLNEINTINEETKCLDEYKAELELLLKEKYTLIEELKQIDFDINEVNFFY